MPIDESPSTAEVTGVTSPKPPSLPFVAESQDTVSLTSQTLSQSVPHSEASDTVNNDHAGSDSDSLFDGLDDFRAVFGSDGESLVPASLTLDMFPRRLLPHPVWCGWLKSRTWLWPMISIMRHWPLLS
jgi:hypothetical protein